MNSGLLSHNNRIVFLSIAAFILIIPFVARATPRDDVSAALIRVTNGDDGLRAGLDELRHLPREDVIPAVVEFLREHPTQENESVGVGLYAVLEFHNAASHEIGYVQLMAGLQSKATRGICAKALAKTPHPQRQDVVARFSTLLLDTALDSSDQESIISALREMGEAASAALRAIETIFSNPKANENLRGLASLAMIDIGGIDFVLERSSDLDSVGQRIIAATLGTKIGRGNRDRNYEDDVAWRDKKGKVQRHLGRLLKSENRDVRSQAMQSLLYGTGIFLGNLEDGFSIDPELEVALRHAADSESDNELRAGANNVLNNVEVWRSQLISRVQRVKAETGSKP